MKLSPILHSQAGWGIFLLYCHPHLTGNDKGLYATMNRWRIDPCYSRATTIFTKTFLLFSLRFQNKSLAL